MKLLSRFLLLYCLTVFGFDVSAQHKDNRTVKKFIREGNTNYTESEYSSAETLYRDALDENPRSSVARFNLGNSLFKQDKFDEAIETYEKLAKDEFVSYNIGNSFLKKEEYEKAIEAYKETLRKNPSDIEAKSNLAYAKKKLQQQEQNKDNQDQNKDNQDQDNKDNQDNKDQKDNKNQDNKDNQDNEDQKDNKNQDNKDNQDNEDQKDNNNQDNKDNQSDNRKESQSQPKMSKDEANYILNAVESNEKNTREKVRKINAEKASKDQPEKNW